MTITNFDKKYAREIDALEDKEWRHLPIKKHHKNGDIIKVALDGARVIGVAYGQKRGDLFIYETCVIAETHRGKNVGTDLTVALIDHARDLGCRNAVARCVYSLGKMNARGLMDKLGFRETLHVRDYWDCYTDAPCRVCGENPCQCTCVFFIKELK